MKRLPWLRYVLTLVLIGFGVYPETGIWTALFAFLTALEVEYRVYCKIRKAERYREMNDALAPFLSPAVKEVKP